MSALESVSVDFGRCGILPEVTENPLKGEGQMNRNQGVRACTLSKGSLHASWRLGLTTRRAD